MLIIEMKLGTTEIRCTYNETPYNQYDQFKTGQTMLIHCIRFVQPK